MGKLLKFGIGNAKLDKGTATFSLPAGWTCPGAQDCLSRADKDNGKITDGKHTEFRCFAASSESLFKTAREARWYNFELLRNSEDMAALIEKSIPAGLPKIRVHVGGDFFSLEYLQSWLKVALAKPNIIFYFYTKSIPFWLETIRLIGNGHEPGHIRNVVPTASFGSKYDGLIKKHRLRTARVVYSETEAKSFGLELDHTDALASKHGSDFALLIHGIQPKGSESNRKLTLLKQELGYTKGAFGYNRKTGRFPLTTI